MNRPSIPTPRGLWNWLQVFGPGAIIASLTIGTGELIFSTRAAALFGYRVLFLFVVICLLKWALVLASARHMVLTGVHPYQRMTDLPGPRGWLPLLLFLVAAVCIPIWVSFHSGVLGNFTAWMTGTQGSLGGGVDYLWGAGILAFVLAITATGGYATLERIQLVIVTAMVFCAFLTLVLYRPDWWELFRGASVPQVVRYPPWLATEYPEVARQPVWVELTRYVGVIGGGVFDYMAYTSFLRDKGWGEAGQGPASVEQLAAVAVQPNHAARQWLRAPLIDCSLSFLVVVVFTAVFVAAGAIVLGPQHLIPNEENLLSLQAAFVTSVHPWLMPLYCAGAFLAMSGTLYGTLEVAGSLAVEMAACVRQEFAERTCTANQANDGYLVRYRRVRDPLVVMRLSGDRCRGEAASFVGDSDSRQRADRRPGLRFVVRAESVDGSTVSSADAAVSTVVVGGEPRGHVRIARGRVPRLLGQRGPLVRFGRTVHLAGDQFCRRLSVGA